MHEPGAAGLPRVSVIVATCDRPALLERAVAAVLAQDYPGEIECIVVYDHVGVRTFPTADGPGRSTRFLANTHRQGLPGGRNTGIDAATGDLIAFCDDDDIWLPAKLRRQVELMTGAGTGAVGCGVRLRGPGIDRERLLDRDRVTLDELLADRVMELHSSTVLVRRDMMVAAGPFDEDIPGGYSEDYEWLLRLAAHTAVAVCREALVIVDWHGGSFYFGRWATIVEAQRYLIRKHAALHRSRTGMARIRGQIAFALAAGNRRAEALRELAAVVRLNPWEKRVLVTWPVLMCRTACERVRRSAQKRGRGV